MIEQSQKQPPFGSILQSILMAALALVLPVIQWSIFGWLHVLLPLLAFYILGKFGTYTGKKILIIAALLGIVVFLFYKNYELFLFSIAMVVTGFVLHLSRTKGDQPAVSGVKGFGTLSGCWLAIFMLTSFGAEVNSYQLLINTLDTGITEALGYYRESGDISAESLVILESTLVQMKTIVPVIMPSILGSMILFVIWFTMVLGNRLLRTISTDDPWGHYRLWQLPDKLIWVGILLGLCSILPLSLIKSFGINGLILLSVIYTFQGLSIVVYFMHKWNVPILLRSFLYVMVILQSFGTIILLICGVADIWFDFRKMKKAIPESNE